MTVLISFIISAYRAGVTIGETLSSIFGSTAPGDCGLEVIVVDDDGPDGKGLQRVVSSLPSVRISKLTTKQGKCAAVVAR